LAKPSKKPKAKKKKKARVNPQLGKPSTAGSKNIIRKKNIERENNTVDGLSKTVEEDDRRRQRSDPGGLDLGKRVSHKNEVRGAADKSFRQPGKNDEKKAGRLSMG